MLEQWDPFLFGEAAYETEIECSL
ncbi:DUF1871 family protein [Falsibacillus albus]|uniref:DUF1871 family protein n=1 Tax=Falsibacillus albus TaxID=2478915 RepID=A0A3L7K242_9BACI|nr:DUF1871 family protein [Falsibacillus albus]